MTAGRPPDGARWSAERDPTLSEEVQRLAAAAGVRWPSQRSPPAATAGRAGAACWSGPTRPGRWPARGGAAAAGRGAGGLCPSRHAGRAGRARADAAWRHAVALGAEQVAVLPVARRVAACDRLARTVEPASTAHVVGVLGGCGGAGASLFAVRPRGRRCGRRAGAPLLVDLDPLGGGLDLALGLDDVPGLRWPDLAAARGRLPASSLHESLPRAGSARGARWGRGEPVDVPVAAGGRGARRRGPRPRPRGARPGAVPGRAVECALSTGSDELLLVVPTRLRAVVAARSCVAALGPLADRAWRWWPGGGPTSGWTGRRVADALGPAAGRRPARRRPDRCRPGPRRAARRPAAQRRRGGRPTSAWRRCLAAPSGPRRAAVA